MKRFSSRTLLAAATLQAFALMACGDDGSNNPSPDAAPPVDSGPSCTAVSVGATQSIVDATEDAILWSSPVTGIAGAAGDTLLNFEFYNGIETLATTISLTAGNQADYATCAACIRLLELNAAGDDIAKQYFQSGGTITLTEDPFTNQKMIGTMTDVTVVEVTIDAEYHSTLVPGGACLSLGTITLNADAVPTEWTCDKAAYNDGTTCNCACGAHDPDCDIMAAPVAGCTANQVCGDDDTCISTCNVLSSPPMGCTTGTCGFNTATQDICYTDATLVDPAALGAACATATPFLCGVTATVATGLCDNFEGDDKICRKACDANADCTGTEVCGAVVGMKGLCIAPPLNDTCETAQLITIGTPVQGKTGGAAGNYNMGLEGAACTGVSQAGGDVVYQVVLTANQTITVNVTNASAHFDPSVALLGPGAAATVCNAATVTCLKGADAGNAAANETFTFTATAAGTYFLIVDTFFRTQGGTFTLTVTSP
ncbi:MAG: uncharacterized protein JWP01_693 [Myxococcales bacterium]|nr:uncharacterized protein [Myxococcales bacterium]